MVKDLENSPSQGSKMTKMTTISIFCRGLECWHFSDIELEIEIIHENTPFYKVVWHNMYF